MHEHDHEETGGSEGGAHFSKIHLLVMALGCLIPFIALLIAVNSNIEATYLPFLLVLLCPLMMILMHLPSMIFRKKRHSKS